MVYFLLTEILGDGHFLSLKIVARLNFLRRFKERAVLLFVGRYSGAVSIFVLIVLVEVIVVVFFFVFV